MLLLRLGFFWTLGLLSFFFFIMFYFQKFSVYLFWSVTKKATDIKPGNVTCYFPKKSQKTKTKKTKNAKL